MSHRRKIDATKTRAGHLHITRCRPADVEDAALWVYTEPPPEPPPTQIELPVIRHTTLADFAYGRSYDGAILTTTSGDGALALAPQAGGIGAWERLPSLPKEIVNFQAVAAKDHLFVIGGNVPDEGRQRSVYSARIRDEGVLDHWRETTPLPQALAGHSALVAGEHLFIIGGFNANGSQSTVFSARIKSDGTLGSWATLSALPQPLTEHAVVAAYGYLYVLGGEVSAEPAVVSDKLYRARLGPGDTLGPWEMVPGGLPEPTNWHAAVAACNHMYMIAGADTTYERNAVYQAEIRSDGGLEAWGDAPPLPKTLIIHTAVPAHGGILVAGGWHGGDTPIETQRKVYWAPFQPDCTLGAWSVASYSRPRKVS